MLRLRVDNWLYDKCVLQSAIHFVSIEDSTEGLTAGPNEVLYSIRPNILLRMNDNFLSDVGFDRCGNSCGCCTRRESKEVFDYLRGIAGCVVFDTEVTLHLPRMYSPLLIEAVNDLLENPARQYAQARARISGISVHGYGNGPFLRRIYDDPTLFPSLEHISIASAAFFVETDDMLYLRARRISITIRNMISDRQTEHAVRHAVCDELSIGVLDDGNQAISLQLTNPYARVVTLPYMPPRHEFANARTIMFRWHPDFTVHYMDAVCCPQLEAVFFQHMLDIHFAIAIEGIPTLRWLPMDFSDMHCTHTWLPLLGFRHRGPPYLPGHWPCSLAQKRAIVAAKAPHLLPLLEQDVRWSPLYRYNDEFNKRAAVFLMAIDVLVGMGRVHYIDPAVLECVLRAATSPS
jgi:hypothetical protein